MSIRERQNFIKVKEEEKKAWWAIKEIPNWTEITLHQLHEKLIEKHGLTAYAKLKLPNDNDIHQSKYAKRERLKEKENLNDDSKKGLKQKL